MQTKTITIHYIQTTTDALPEPDRSLALRAIEMTRNSLAHYSHFHVGAAILMENGEIIAGSNQENAAYPSGLCAERTAAFSASALYPGIGMKKIAIAAATEAPDDSLRLQPQPISPCGACRQSLMEYEKLYGPIEVILCGADATYVFPSVASLLPFSFTDF